MMAVLPRGIDKILIIPAQKTFTGPVIYKIPLTFLREIDETFSHNGIDGGPGRRAAFTLCAGG
jgi:hypothetical protein